MKFGRLLDDDDAFLYVLSFIGCRRHFIVFDSSIGRKEKNQTGRCRDDDRCRNNLAEQNVVVCVSPYVPVGRITVGESHHRHVCIKQVSIRAFCVYIVCRDRIFNAAAAVMAAEAQ